MAVRTLITYYDIDRGRWCTEDGASLIERQWPKFNLWETPIIVVNIRNGNNGIVAIEADSTFSLVVTDKNDVAIAVPIAGRVNLEDDYEDVAPENGILSFMLSIDTIEALSAITGFKDVPVTINLNIDNALSNRVMNLTGEARLNKVTRLDKTPVPTLTSGQYRINPVDNQTDIYDFKLNRWMRGILEGGVMKFYEAPA